METTSSGNPIGALLGFWMLMQLVLLIGLLLGGIYVLYCLGRAASGLDRLASAVEALVLDKLNKENPPAPPAPVSFAIPPYPSPQAPPAGGPVAPPPTYAPPGSPPPPAPSPFQQAPTGASGQSGEPRPTNPAELGPPDSATVHPGGPGNIGGPGEAPPRL